MHDALKDQLYGQFARIGSAISSPKRLEIIDLLSQGEKTVDSIARHARLTVGNASAHLKVLRTARLVDNRREGQHVFYRLADDTVFRFFREFQALARDRLVEVEQMARLYFENPDLLDPVTAGELLARLRDDDVIVLDVRPEEEYRAGHIPGAVAVPPDELEERLRGLPVEREIVAYCRGPYCFFSVEAVELLQQHGYRARRLAVGFPDWRTQGLPVAVATEDSPGSPETIHSGDPGDSGGPSE